MNKFRYAGPYFLIKGKIYSLKEDINKLKEVGGFKNHPSSHMEFFDSLSGGHGIHYGRYPRGRVIYHVPSDSFYLYGDKEIISKNELIEEIKKIYNLSNSVVLIRSDEHYVHDDF